MLAELLRKVVQVGADELEIEHRDQEECFTAFLGQVGVGIGNMDSEQAKPLFEELKALKRAKAIALEGRTYGLRFCEYESFGETVYRIKLKEKPELAGNPRLAQPPTRKEPPHAK